MKNFYWRSDILHWTALRSMFPWQERKRVLGINAGL